MCDGVPGGDTSPSIVFTKYAPTHSPHPLPLALNVTEALSDTVAPRLVVMHLLMSMTNRFDAVMVKHFAKGLARRLVAHR